ncbi:hypothetical protein NMB96_08940 [Xanthomonas hortorum]|uniref:hypothetical protein n=1 Tax=Xanthomonas hortorum TaxID=56454 RepID=UPI0020CFE491|nr:hypothetical protein [Xanthomonas hortorum]UTS74896.1 hypothetical protein NMB96_08940 [Xanthomonas hortorum]
MNEVERKAHLELLGRISAIETTLRVLIIASDDSTLLKTLIRENAAALIALMRSRGDMAGNALADGIEEGIDLITDGT